MGWTFLTNVIDKTPTTTGAWVDIDVSTNVPAGTKAVLLKIVNTLAIAPTYGYGIRPVGSTVTRTLWTEAYSIRTWNIAIVKLDSNYKFQAWIESTSIKIYLWGYTDEDICFIDPYDKSTTTTGAWVDVSNDELPNGAKGAIYERHNSYTTAEYILGLRPKGSTSTLQPKIMRKSHGWSVIGIDTNKYSQQYIDSIYCKLYLWGHAGSDFVPFTDPYNITPTTTGAYVTVDLSSYIPDGAYGICGLIINTSTSTVYKGDVRKYGSTDDHSANSSLYYPNLGRFFIVGCSSDRKVDIYIDNTAVKVYLWGYFKLPVITATFTETVTLSDVTLKGTSKTFTETTSLSDVISKGTSKAFTETIALSDIISYLKIIIKELTESLTLSDIISKKTTKTLTESISLSDIISKITSRTFTESISLTDKISKYTIKTFIEQITLIDKFYRLLPPIEFVETIYLTDKVFRVAPAQRAPITPTRIISPTRTKKPDRIERIV
jgi:hypothetical protein